VKGFFLFFPLLFVFFFFFFYYYYYYYCSVVAAFPLLLSLTFSHKKRLSLPDSQSFFVNLKSNTMKNTLQRYFFVRILQTFGSNPFFL